MYFDFGVSWPFKKSYQRVQNGATHKTISLWWCQLIFNYSTNVTGKGGFPLHSIKTQRSTVKSLHPAEQVSKFPT